MASNYLGKEYIQYFKDNDVDIEDRKRLIKSAITDIQKQKINKNEITPNLKLNNTFVPFTQVDILKKAVELHKQS